MNSGLVAGLVSALAGLALSGCSGIDDGPAGGHTVNWYLHHQGQMHKESKWCADSAARPKSMSCKNAAKAGNEALSYNAKKTAQSLAHDLS